MNLITEFNKVAELAGVPTLTQKRIINVHHDNTKYPITVWRIQDAAKLGQHNGTNEDGYRWKAVYSGIPQATGNYKPF